MIGHGEPLNVWESESSPAFFQDRIDHRLQLYRRFLSICRADWLAAMATSVSVSRAKGSTALSLRVHIDEATRRGPKRPRPHRARQPARPRDARPPSAGRRVWGRPARSATSSRPCGSACLPSAQGPLPLSPAAKDGQEQRQTERGTGPGGQANQVHRNVSTRLRRWHFEIRLGSPPCFRAG